jgi:hypothetical protein
MRRAGWLLALLAVPAWASHPLISEDTGTLGKGKWELELHGERARDRESDLTTHNTEGILKLGRGVAENLDLEIELRYLRESADGTVLKGPGDASLAAKWRFYDSDALSLVLKPELVLPTGREEVGLGAGQTRWGVIVAAAYELARFEFIANLGYLHNRNDLGERESVSYQSIALRFAATEKVQLVADLVRATNPDPQGAHERVLVAGVTYEFSERLEVGLGVQEGLTDAADDRAVRLGVKLRF